MVFRCLARPRNLGSLATRTFSNVEIPVTPVGASKGKPRVLYQPPGCDPAGSGRADLLGDSADETPDEVDTRGDGQNGACQGNVKRTPRSKQGDATIRESRPDNRCFLKREQSGTVAGPSPDEYLILWWNFPSMGS